MVISFDLAYSSIFSPISPKIASGPHNDIAYFVKLRDILINSSYSGLKEIVKAESMMTPFL